MRLCLYLCVNACTKIWVYRLYSTRSDVSCCRLQNVLNIPTRVYILYIQRARAGGWGLDWNIQKHKEDRRKNKPNERENTRTDTPNQTELKPKSNERRVETCVLYILRAAAAAVTQWHYWWLWLLLRLLPSLLLFFVELCVKVEKKNETDVPRSFVCLNDEKSLWHYFFDNFPLFLPFAVRISCAQNVNGNKTDKTVKSKDSRFFMLEISNGIFHIWWAGRKKWTIRRNYRGL